MVSISIEKVDEKNSVDSPDLDIDVQSPSPTLFPRLFQENVPYITSFEQYKQMYDESVNNPNLFWTKQANSLLTWRHPFTSALHGSLLNGDVSWFADGEINACYNMVDRHAFTNPDKVAIIYEADEPHMGHELTYSQLLRKVCQLAGLLKQQGVKKGDTVAIYMPMIPEVAIAMLACTRIGAVHSVIFAGFSSESIRDRIIDANSHFIITANEGRRGGRIIATKKFVDEAIKLCPEDQCRCVVVFQHTATAVPMIENRDVCWNTEIPKFRGYCPCTTVSAEDPLFILYTSGSTGAPKGVLHTTGGYLVGAACTTKYVFDLHPNDIMGCAGDVGWITGHTYIVYGPLLLGASTLIFEGTPTYPTPSRYWEIVEKHKITQWYVAPTAIRLLARNGDKYVTEGGNRSSLRILGSVGEPIAPETYKWYQEVVGSGECCVVDTYWQTETGSHAITAIPAAITVKPGSATLPFFGIVPAILDPVTAEEMEGAEVEGVLTFKQPWPSMARSVWNNHERFLDTYLRPYPGYYFTGDGAGRDSDGYYWIRGRIDDVINVSGHRLSTAEIESAIIQHIAVAEAAVVGNADELQGQSINAFVLLRQGFESSDELRREIILQVRKSIGPFAAPKQIFFSDLPKTRSGKIMRRILRKVVDGEHHALGDISTLADPGIVSEIIQNVHMAREVIQRH